MRPFDSNDAPALRKRLRAAFAALFFAGSLFGSTAASALTISESNFSDSDWTSFEFRQFGAGGTMIASQTLSVGNPAPAYDVTLTGNVGPTSGAFAFHRYDPSVYDPAVEGALLGLDVAIEGQIPSTAGTPQLLRFGIEQNGVVYESNFGALVNLAAFTNIALTGQIASDFFSQDLRGGTPPPLDFSATGAPISFGFTTANTTSNPSGFVTRGIYDNFNVSTVVPEPGAGILLTMGLAFVRATRRRVRVGNRKVERTSTWLTPNASSWTA